MPGRLDMGYMLKTAKDEIDWVHETIAYGDNSTKYTLSLLPRKCRSSNKNIWFKFAYRVRHTYHEMHGNSNEDRWYDKHEYIKLRLQG